jgi:hypothetical protein
LASIRSRIIIVSPKKTAENSGSAVSDEASGLIAVNGIISSVGSGGRLKPIAASFGGAS